jgi:hypothetical protein
VYYLNELLGGDVNSSLKIVGFSKSLMKEDVACNVGLVWEKVMPTAI